MTNNQGIMHAAFKIGGTPLCRKKNAHMSVSIDAFRSYPKPCKRCIIVLAKMDASAKRKRAS